MSAELGANEILDPRDAAAYLRLNEQTIRRLAREGEIPAFKVGGSWRFRRRSLERWAADQESKLRRPSVLLIEDSESLRRVARTALEKEGLRVRLARSREEALLQLGQEAPEVVLLAVGTFAQETGEILARMRQRWPSVVITLLTDPQDASILPELLVHSPLTLQSKPASGEQIVKVVFDAVRR